MSRTDAHTPPYLTRTEVEEQAKARRSAARRRDFRRGVTLAQELDFLAERQHALVMVKALLRGTDRAKQGRLCTCCHVPRFYCVWR